MKALIGVDGSDGAWEALHQAAELLPDKGELVLYYSPPKLHLLGTHASEDFATRARNNLAKAVFDEARARLPTKMQGSVKTITGVQGPRRGLILAADQVQADFIAVG